MSGDRLAEKLAFIEQMANQCVLDLIEEAHVLALVEIAKAASDPVDIGDEINRCRLCWETWGRHTDDCPLAGLDSGATE